MCDADFITMSYSINVNGVCPHCNRSVRFIEPRLSFPGGKGVLSVAPGPASTYHLNVYGEEDHILIETSRCPACMKPIVYISHKTVNGIKDEDYLAFPRYYQRFVPTEVPSHIKDDFLEAVAVLSISEKASAALSRRCLQSLLLDQGAPRDDLSKQIAWGLPKLPSYLANDLDAIRNVGNFAAHPIKDKNTERLLKLNQKKPNGT